VTHPYTTANRAIWLARQFLKKKNPGMYAFHGVFPADLAKDSGMTRLESELSLRSLCLFTPAEANRRKDGRYFLTEKGRNA
jgi:hypothetical protein